NAGHCASIVQEFSDSAPDRDLISPVGEIGTIRVILKTDESVRYSWFFAGDKRTLLFSSGGVRYRRSKRKHGGEESLVFDAFVRKLITPPDAAAENPTKP